MCGCVGVLRFGIARVNCQAVRRESVIRRHFHCSCNYGAIRSRLHCLVTTFPLRHTSCASLLKALVFFSWHLRKSTLRAESIRPSIARAAARGSSAWRHLDKQSYFLMEDFARPLGLPPAPLALYRLILGRAVVLQLPVIVIGSVFVCKCDAGPMNNKMES